MKIYASKILDIQPKVLSKILQKRKIDYFIYGHIHDPKNIELNNNSRYVNLGDCVQHFSYAELDGETLLLKNF